MDRRSFLSAGTRSHGKVRPVQPTPPKADIAPLAIDAGLEPYDAPLDHRRAAHLLRRTGFGADAAEVDALEGLAGTDAVDQIVSTAVAEPPLEPPDWADDHPPGRGASEQERQAYIDRNRERLLDFGAEWLERMQSGSLRERLTLFWHDHFVTEVQVYNLAPYAYRYLTLLREHALGNFKTFVRAVGLDPAMLLYLNGAQNEVGAPNENYARELMELFTMGITGPDGTPNYLDSENPPGDVQEVARALTGWVVDHAALSAVFVPSRHDAGLKTIFGREGAFGYDNVVDLLFEARADAIAHFISRKIYQEFVYEGANDAIVSDLADLLVQHNFDIEPIVLTLLGSAHFFDSEVIGARIKSPIELIVGLKREAYADFSEPSYGIAGRLLALMEQVPLNPPNVAGWPGHHAWISTTTLPVRWITSDLFLFGRGDIESADVLRLANDLSDPAWEAQFVDAFRLPEAIAEHLLAVPIEHASFAAIAEDFAGDLDTYPIPKSIVDAPEYVRNVAKIFLAGAPWYEWNLRADGADGVLRAFIRYLMQLPEYQLT